MLLKVVQMGRLALTTKNFGGRTLAVLAVLAVLVVLEIVESAGLRADLAARATSGAAPVGTRAACLKISVR
ncbi:hypothetical protein KIM372_02330 [Bombiscardovia nodaiensis]|uniref:ABC transporter permease n=1 Tax=Bombiscardovia nodaiensis TaxID=2932181 RepID=A0ABM8B6G7_9BIFI|nr:hypothetical protein KIM372_02330 [Bombiscardovia nodaiensis]